MSTGARVVSLISAADIRRRGADMATRIAEDYGSTPPVLVGVLNGAVQFMMDLLAALPASVAERINYDFIVASSYVGTERRNRVEVLNGGLAVDVRGRPALVVEGIVDSGYTAVAVRDYLLVAGAQRVDICTLLDKPSRRVIDVELRYRGFEIDDVFVVGYGMDADQRYRSLRDIGVLTQS